MKTPKTRNDLRRFVAGTLEKLSLGAVGLGLLRPAFDVSIGATWLTTGGSLALGAIAYMFAVLVMRGLEDEN